MADDTPVPMTVGKMARMTANTRERERKRCARVAIEWGDAALGRGDQKEGEAMYALAETLSPGLLAAMETERVRQFGGAVEEPKAAPTERVVKTAETATRPADMSKFVVEGVENEQFPGWDSALRDGDGLPPATEHGDIEQAENLIRRGKLAG